MADWQLKRGSEAWPVADAEMLREWAKNGRVQNDDYVFNPVLGTWMYAKDVAELAGVLDPNRKRCPFCGSYSVQRMSGLQGSENLIGCFLACLFLLPLLLYYFATTAKLYCTNCKRRIPTGGIADSIA